MSPYDDEFPDLTDDLRRSRPQADRLPSAFNRQLRTALIKEAEQMNMAKRTVNNWATALGTLAIVIALPVLFWVLMSTQRPEAPQYGAAPMAETADDAAQDAVQEAADDMIEITNVELLSAADTVAVAVTVSYQLSAEAEAEAFVHFVVPHEGGEFRGGEALMVSAESDTAVLDLILPPFAVDETGELNEGVTFLVELNLTAEEIERASGRPTADEDDYAVITGILPARLSEQEGMMDVPVQFEYQLTDAPRGTVLVSYELIPVMQADPAEVVIEEVDGDVVLELVKGTVVIEQGGSTGEVILSLPAELVNADGSLADNVALLLELALEAPEDAADAIEDISEEAVDLDGAEADDIVDVDVIEETVDPSQESE